jgi:type 1 fimbriae regulatory protein FimB/type 1 fimbriae regulatory protein FimE
VRRPKGGEDGQHPIGGREIRGLRKLRRQQPVGARYVFVTDRGAPMTRNGFYKLLAKAGKAAGLDDVHPHLLRHGCGFKLVNAVARGLSRPRQHSEHEAVCADERDAF